MKALERALPFLCCPTCRFDKLEFQLSKKNTHPTAILCTRCGTTYPIIKGVARLHKNLSRRVKVQSKVYSYFHSLFTKENSFNYRQSDKRVVTKTLNFAEDDFRSRILLDAGCGIGRFSYPIAKMVQDGLVICMDISEGVESAYENLIEFENYVVIQGDILNPPFRDQVFDAVLSWGVIHHTENPRLAFTELTRILKMGGKLGIYVYESHPTQASDKLLLLFVALLRQGILIKPLRAVCSRLPIRFVECISAICWFVAAITRVDVLGVASGPKGNRFNYSTWRGVFIDRFYTRCASEHSYQEMLSWYLEEGFDYVELPLNTMKITISGTRSRKLKDVMHCKILGPGTLIRSRGASAES